jgi:hypothetical protein
VVVVVRPPDAEPVLPLLLDAGGPVPPLPELPLGREEQVARMVDAEVRYGRVDQPAGVGEPVGVVGERPAAEPERLSVGGRRPGGAVVRRLPAGGHAWSPCRSTTDKARADDRRPHPTHRPTRDLARQAVVARKSRHPLDLGVRRVVRPSPIRGAAAGRCRGVGEHARCRRHRPRTRGRASPHRPPPAAGRYVVDQFGEPHAASAYSRSA